MIVEPKWQPDSLYLTYKRQPQIVWQGDGEYFRAHLGGNYPTEMFTSMYRIRDLAVGVHLYYYSYLKVPKAFLI